MFISLAPLRRPFLNKIDRNSAAFYSGGHFIRHFFWVMRPNNRPVGNPRAAPLYAEGCSPEISWSGAVLSCITKGWSVGEGEGYGGRKTREKKRKKWWKFVCWWCNWERRNTCLIVSFLFLIIALIVVLWACDDSTVWDKYRRWRKNS